jgi:hypothetical protein
MASANDQASNGSVEQALIVTIPLSDGKSGKHDEVQRLFKLEDELMKAIEDSGVGEYDGNEIARGHSQCTPMVQVPRSCWMWRCPSLRSTDCHQGLEL